MITRVRSIRLIGRKQRLSFVMSGEWAIASFTHTKDFKLQKLGLHILIVVGYSTKLKMDNSTRFLTVVWACLTTPQEKTAQSKSSLNII